MTAPRCQQRSAHVCWLREWMGPGGSRGLQNRCGAAFVVPGGFDSLALPPPILILDPPVPALSSAIRSPASRPEILRLTATVTATRADDYGRVWNYDLRMASMATAASRCIVGVTWL